METYHSPKVQAPSAASSEHGSAHGHPDLKAANGATFVGAAPPGTSSPVSNCQSGQDSASINSSSGHNSAHPNVESKAVGTLTTINATSQESSSPTANASTASDTSERSLNAHQNLKRQEWEGAAVELYLRSGSILSVELMGDVFNEAKENLRKLLYVSIMKGHDANQTELELDGWALYQEMKFQMYKHLDNNKRVVHGENQFSDLMVPTDQDLYDRSEELLETDDGVLGSVVEALEVFVENPRDTLFENVEDYFERFQELETEQPLQKYL
ncbi:unnamed protein product [Caenorhabditis brenneri]